LNYEEEGKLRRIGEKIKIKKTRKFLHLHSERRKPLSTLKFILKKSQTNLQDSTKLLAAPSVHNRTLALFQIVNHSFGKTVFGPSTAITANWSFKN